MVRQHHQPRDSGDAEKILRPIILSLIPSPHYNTFFVLDVLLLSFPHSQTGFVFGESDSPILFDDFAVFFYPFPCF